MIKEKTLLFKRTLVILIILSLLSIILSFGFGSVKISFAQTMRVLEGLLFESNSGAVTDLEKNIIVNLRMPRVFIGFIVGAALSVSGVVMQSIIKNPMADPFVLGVSSGAGFFATLAMIYGGFGYFGSYALPLAAFLGSLCSLIIVMIIQGWSKQKGLFEILLIGIVVSMVFDAATRFLVLSAPNALGIHNTEFWMSGSLVNAKWDYFSVPVIAIGVIIIYLIFNYRSLNLMSLGENQAKTLGVNVRLQRIMMIIITSLLTGITISLGGIIGFVGMICPHLSRKLVGGDILKVLPVSFFIGGIMVIWADVLARTVIAPVELPLGLLTAIIGGPIFLILFVFKRK